jgi:hypothetical protein
MNNKKFRLYDVDLGDAYQQSQKDMQSHSQSSPYRSGGC